MGKAGLNHNNLLLANHTACIALAHFVKDLYSSSTSGKAAENIASSLSNLISEAIKSNDISALLKFEKNAIRCDIECYGAVEKRTGSLASLEQVSRLVKQTATKEGARKFLIALNDGKLPKSVPKTDLVINFVKSHRASINHLLEATSSPALKNYYFNRKLGLEHIRNEYINNLNRGLGKEVSRKNEISL